MLETQRLLVRRFAAADDKDLYEYLSVPSTYVFEPGRPVSPAEATELAHQRAAGSDFLAVVLKSMGKMIGHLYLKQVEPPQRLTWELGYIFNPRYHGMGYASEAAAAATEYVFRQHGAHRIMARCNPDNTASWRLLERIGYVREGHFREYGFVHRDGNGDPIWTDAYEYSRVRASP